MPPTQVLQSAEGQFIEAVVLRRGVPTPLQLRPQAWGGRGLL